MGGDDTAGLLEIAELEGDGRADDLVLPVLRDREATRPVRPVVDGAIAEFPTRGLEIALERFIDAEHEV
jgi:hypothetical protein